MGNRVSESYGMDAVVDPGVAISSNSGGLDKKGPVALSEKQGPVSGREGDENRFDIPLGIFHHKVYDSDFFTSLYNILKEVSEEIKLMYPEKRVLNLALSVLMLPYVASISLGLVVYNRSKVNGIIQTSTKVSESTAKRLAHGVLAAIAILVNMVVLVALIIPATLALSIFYIFNKKLSRSLFATAKMVSDLYKSEHQNIEVSFREIDAGNSDIRWDMGIKFPPQFEQLLGDLCEDKSDKLFVTQDTEHNTILKLSANIHLKNGLVPLRDGIRSMLATSVKGFTETVRELLKLDKEDITYDKLKELSNEFRLKAVNGVDPKLISHLIQDAYRVAFIQAIKFVQKRRKEDFSLEERLKEVLVDQELRSRGKELPTEKEMILKDLEELITESTGWFSRPRIVQEQGSKSHIKMLGNGEFPTLKAMWKQLIIDGAIDERTVIGVYKDRYLTETEKALDVDKEKIEELKGMGEKRYDKICEKLKGIHRDIRKNNLKDSTLKRKLEDLFKFEYGNQEVEKRLVRSVMKRAKDELRKSDILNQEKLSLIRKLEDLEKKINEKTLDEINSFVEEMYLEITKLKMRGLLDIQREGVKLLCKTLKMLKQDEPNLVRMIISYQGEIEKCLTEPAQLKEILKKWYKDLDVEKNSEEKGFSSIELIELCLKNNQEILKALENLESEKEGLLINEKTKSDYEEELISREKIKFAIIEDDLLVAFRQEIFNEVKIRKLLEKAELEYCLAEECVKYPVIKTKDNIKHFCQALLYPLIGNLVEKIINHIPKGDKSSAWNPINLYKRVRIAVNYNTLGLLAIGGENSTEGKALKVAHDTHKEVETFLQYFESSYEEVGSLIGDVFSDGGEIFKKDIWPKIRDHLCEMWDRFFKDIEFTLISKDENTNQEIVNTELGQFTIQKHNFIGGPLVAVV